MTTVASSTSQQTLLMQSADKTLVVHRSTASVKVLTESEKVRGDPNFEKTRYDMYKAQSPIVFSFKRFEFLAEQQHFASIVLLQMPWKWGASIGL